MCVCNQREPIRRSERSKVKKTGGCGCHGYAILYGAPISDYITAQLSDRVQDETQTDYRGMKRHVVAAGCLCVHVFMHACRVCVCTCPCLTHVVVLLLWSIKNGRPLGAILISHPGGRKLCVTLCWDLGEL